MPEIITVLRKAAANNAAAAIGAKTGQPTSTAGDQLLDSKAYPDVWRLPIDDTVYQPLQDLDPDSPTFLMDRFVEGLDWPDDPTKYIP